MAHIPALQSDVPLPELAMATGHSQQVLVALQVLGPSRAMIPPQCSPVRGGLALDKAMTGGETHSLKDRPLACLTTWITVSYVELGAHRASHPQALPKLPPSYCVPFCLPFPNLKTLLIGPLQVLSPLGAVLVPVSHSTAPSTALAVAEPRQVTKLPGNLESGLRPMSWRGRPRDPRIVFSFCVGRPRYNLPTISRNVQKLGINDPQNFLSSPLDQLALYN